MSLFKDHPLRAIPKAQIKNSRLLDKGLCYSLGCQLCPLNKSRCISPKMSAYGSSNPEIYFLGDFPGVPEDTIGKPISKEAVKLLYKHFDTTAPHRFNNVVRTHPTKNSVGQAEIECCRKSVEDDILAANPKIIVTFGTTAQKWLGINPLFNVIDVRGRLIPVKIKDKWFHCYPTFSPKTLIRLKSLQKFNGTPDEEKLFNIDVKKLNKIVKNVSDVNESIIDIPKDEHLDLITNPGKMLEALEYFSKTKIFAFDFETITDEKTKVRALRPYGHNAKICVLSMSDGKRNVAFPINHPLVKIPVEQKKVLANKFVEILQSDTKKIAHNLSFEIEWIVKFFGYDAVKNIDSFIDTLCNEYVMETRKGQYKGADREDRTENKLLSLDSLCRFYLGLPLKSITTTNVQDFLANDLMEGLKYAALDSWATFHLNKRQTERLVKKGLINTAKDQASRVVLCSIVRNKGVYFDKQKNAELKKSIDKKISDNLENFLNLESVKQASKFTGKFNINSPDHLMVLFRDVLGVEEGYDKSKVKGYSVRKDILEKMKSKESELLLTHKRWHKAISTYINGYDITFWPDGKLHPELSCTGTVTRRTSCQNPNIQNVIKRNPELSLLIRSQYAAPKGKSIVSIDYGQIEARVLAMATKDDVFCGAIRDGLDIHGDWATRWKEKDPNWFSAIEEKFGENKAFKEARNVIKNQWVFPLFYGAGVRSVSAGMGIATGVGVSEEDCKEMVKDWWSIFSAARDWQKKQIHFYESKGYVELFSGFRCKGPISRNQIFNFPIQGSACDIICQGMREVIQFALKTKDYNFINIWNIHDDLGFYFPDDRCDEYIDKTCELMLKPAQYLPYVNVPMTLEVSTGKRWSELKEIKTVESK